MIAIGLRHGQQEGLVMRLSVAKGTAFVSCPGGQSYANISQTLGSVYFVPAHRAQSRQYTTERSAGMADFARAGPGRLWADFGSIWGQL